MVNTGLRKKHHSSMFFLREFNIVVLITLKWSKFKELFLAQNLLEIDKLCPFVCPFLKVMFFLNFSRFKFNLN